MALSCGCTCSRALPATDPNRRVASSGQIRRAQRSPTPSEAIGASNRFLMGSRAQEVEIAAEVGLRDMLGVKAGVAASGLDGRGDYG